MVSSIHAFILKTRYMCFTLFEINVSLVLYLHENLKASNLLKEFFCYWIVDTHFSLFFLDLTCFCVCICIFMVEMLWKQPQPETEEEILNAIYEYIDRLFAIVRPRRLLYLAIGSVQNIYIPPLSLFLSLSFWLLWTLLCLLCFLFLFLFLFV
jgi:hypothetical protein